MMLKRIVMQLSGRGMAQCIRLWAWLTTQLWLPVSNLLASFTRKFQSVINLLNPLAQMLPSFKAWAANPTIAAPSIKRALSIVKAKAIQIGLRLRIIARQTHQPVKPSRKKGK